MSVCWNTEVENLYFWRSNLNLVPISIKAKLNMNIEPNFFIFEFCCCLLGKLVWKGLRIVFKSENWKFQFEIKKFWPSIFWVAAMLVTSRCFWLKNDDDLWMLVIFYDCGCLRLILKDVGDQNGHHPHKHPIYIVINTFRLQHPSPTTM